MKIPKNRELLEVEFAVPVLRPDNSSARTISHRNYTITYDAEFIYVGSRIYATDWVVGFVLKPLD